MNKALSTLAAVMLWLGQLSYAHADSASYDRALDALTDMVQQYEKVAAKQPLCLTDVNALNIDLIPALTRANAETQQLQSSGYLPGPQQLQRYLAVNGRMQQAMAAFATRMKDARMDC